MEQAKQYIAADLGAESGRVMLASVWADKLALQEVYRFANHMLTSSFNCTRADIITFSAK